MTHYFTQRRREAENNEEKIKRTGNYKFFLFLVFSSLLSASLRLCVK